MPAWHHSQLFLRLELYCLCSKQWMRAWKNWTFVFTHDYLKLTEIWIWPGHFWFEYLGRLPPITSNDLLSCGPIFIHTDMCMSNGVKDSGDFNIPFESSVVTTVPIHWVYYVEWNAHTEPVSSARVKPVSTLWRPGKLCEPGHYKDLFANLIHVYMLTAPFSSIKFLLQKEKNLLQQLIH